MIRIYKVEASISGNNEQPEVHEQQIIADGWQEVHELMARICRDTGSIIREIRIIETNDQPFSYKTVKNSIKA